MIERSILVTAAIILLIAFNMDTSVEHSFGRVQNIGLLSTKNSWITIGAVFLLAGLILTGLKRIHEATSDKADLVKCPSCAELINKDAKICKHCKSEITPQDQLETPEIKNDTIPESGPEDSAHPDPIQLNRSKLNRTHSEDFASKLCEAEIRSTLAREFKKIQIRFDEEKLMYIDGKTVYVEVSLKKNEDDNWLVNVDYEKDRNILIPAATISTIIMAFSFIAGEPIFFIFFMIPISIFFIMQKLLSNEFTKKQILGALNRLREQV